MKNGCIFLISARKDLLKICLENLFKNYNNKFKYPVLIFYHGKIYDEIEFQNNIKEVGENITFYKLEAKIPSHINESDLFYNLKNNRYASSFGKSRIGYLHANYFWNNFMNYKELENYDYLMRIDDDSWFKKEINFDFFEEIDKENYLCGTAYSWNHVHSRVLETRQYFYKWIYDYIKTNNINVKNNILKDVTDKFIENDIVNNIRCNKRFHSMFYLSGNCNIYNRKMFITDEWKNYLNKFNELAGGFRYRWGDCELISMYCYMFLDNGFKDFDLKNKGIYHNQLPGTSFVYRDDL